MRKIFFTSDWHFSHRNIAKFCPHTRPQGDIEQLDRYLIDMWNDTVDANDIVYNLGDLSFSHDLKQIKRVLAQLNGEHHLIYGNHDDVIKTHIAKLLNEYKPCGKPLLSSAQDYLKLSLKEVGKNLILFHYPIAEWDGCHKGYYHLHGHIHQRMSEVKGRILNVGLDLHAKMLSLEDVIDLLEPLPRLDHFSEQNPNDHLSVPQILQAATDYHLAKNDAEVEAYKQTIKQVIKDKLSEIS